MFINILYVLAIISQSINGTLSAKKRRMDHFGVVLIAFVSAFGGGTLRDLLLNNYPISWVKEPFTICIVIVVCFSTIVLFHLTIKFKNLFLLLDAFGLVSLTIIGCDAAAKEQSSLLLIGLFGVITGVFGGIMRDIFSNQTPLIFQKEMYASISVATAAIYVSFMYWSIPSGITIFTALALGFLLRLDVVRKIK